MNLYLKSLTALVACLFTCASLAIAQDAGPDCRGLERMCSSANKRVTSKQKRVDKAVTRAEKARDSKDQKIARMQDKIDSLEVSRSGYIAEAATLTVRCILDQSACRLKDSLLKKALRIEVKIHNAHEKKDASAARYDLKIARADAKVAEANADLAEAQSVAADDCGTYTSSCATTP